MSMSKSSYNYNRVTWEDSEFPILCQTCLGDNPYLRMMKEKFGKECAICQRPFTTFRWCPGKGMRYKKTEICQTCSKLKNVCQTCLLDLEYGLPVQVRDYALQLKDDIPKSGANKDFYIQNIDRELAQTDGTTPAGSLAKIPDQGPNEMLLKLARTQPYYERNKPHICSFWVKGECKRGEECPYRHTKPTDPDDPLSDQNMKDRFFGMSDPVADKLLNRAKAMPQLKPPEDRTITTLYIGNLGDEGYITDADLRNYFYQFGELRNISVIAGKGCAFVQFTARQSAEMAAEKAYNKLQLKNRRITVRWGRPHAQHNAAPGTADERGRTFDEVPGLPGALPLPPSDFFNLDSQQRGVSSSSTGASGIDEGASAAKRVRAEIPPPPSFMGAPVRGVGQLTPRLPSGMMMGPPRGMPRGPPPMMRVPYINPRPGGPGASVPPPPGVAVRVPGPPPKIHYPSQDPQHLGARDMRD